MRKLSYRRLENVWNGWTVRLVVSWEAEALLTKLA